MLYYFVSVQRSLFFNLVCHVNGGPGNGRVQGTCPNANDVCMANGDCIGTSNYNSQLLALSTYKIYDNYVLMTTKNLVIYLPIKHDYRLLETVPGPMITDRV